MTLRSNLVHGVSAGGLLRQACRQYNVAGRVHVIDDELGVGPLEDDDLRSSWWREVSAFYLDGYEADFRPHAQFQRLRAITPPNSEVALWCGDNHDDYVFCRMAAAYLGHVSELSIIELPNSLHLPHVGAHSPDLLASFEKLKRRLSVTERSSLASEFEALTMTSGVRRLTDQGLTLRGYEDADEEIWDASKIEWKRKHYVVGGAMAARDVRNWLGDMFMYWRVRELVSAGRLEHRGESWFVEDRTSEIRRAT